MTAHVSTAQGSDSSTSDESKRFVPWFLSSRHPSLSMDMNIYIQEKDIAKLLLTGIDGHDCINEPWVLSYVESQRGTDVQLYKPRFGEEPISKFVECLTTLCTKYQEEEMWRAVEKKSADQKINKRFGSNVKKLWLSLNYPPNNTDGHWEADKLCALKENGIDMEVRLIQMKGAEVEANRQGLLAMVQKGIKVRACRPEDWRQVVRLTPDTASAAILKEMFQEKNKAREEADSKTKQHLKDILDKGVAEGELPLALKSKVYKSVKGVGNTFQSKVIRRQSTSTDVPSTPTSPQPTETSLVVTEMKQYSSEGTSKHESPITDTKGVTIGSLERASSKDSEVLTNGFHEKEDSDNPLHQEIMRQEAVTGLPGGYTGELQREAQARQSPWKNLQNSFQFIRRFNIKDEQEGSSKPKEYVASTNQEMTQKKTEDQLGQKITVEMTLQSTH